MKSGVRLQSSHARRPDRQEPADEHHDARGRVPARRRARRRDRLARHPLARRRRRDRRRGRDRGRRDRLARRGARHDRADPRGRGDARAGDGAARRDRGPVHPRPACRSRRSTSSTTRRPTRSRSAGRPTNSGVAVTSGLLNLMSRRELEGVLAHEMSHIRNRDVQVTTLAVTTVGLLVAVAEISARGVVVRRLGRQRQQRRRSRADRGRRCSPASWRSARACSRSRSPVTARSSPTRARPRSSRPTGCARRSRSSKPTTPCCTTCRARPRTSGSSTPLAHRGRRTATPRLNRLFDTHPPLDERIAILRKLEGLDPNERGPVDETSTGVPVDLAKLTASTERRTAPRSGAPRRRSRRRRRSTRPPQASPADSPKPTRRPRPARRRPVIRRAGTTPTRETLRYWDGTAGPTGPRSGTAAAGCSRRAERDRGASVIDAALAQARELVVGEAELGLEHLGGVLPDPRHARLGTFGHLRQLHRVAGHEHRLGRRRRCAASRRACAAPRRAGRRSRRARGCSARRRCRPR